MNFNINPPKEKEERKRIMNKENLKVIAESLRPEDGYDTAVSLFKNFYDSVPIGKVSLRKWLLTDLFKHEVSYYRKNKDESVRKKLKANNPCVTVSGLFNKRTEHGLEQHSGYLCVDIDNEENQGRDLQKGKEILFRNMPSIMYAGDSIGGKGIYLVIKIKSPKYHMEHFKAVEKELWDNFRGLRVDKSCKNVSRLRSISYDENGLFRDDPEEYDKILKDCYVKGNFTRTPDEDEELRVRVDRLVKQISERKINMAEGYRDWFRIGSALVSEFGKEAEYYFHMISRQSPKYTEVECQRQFGICLKHRKEKVSIGTFFWYCKEAELSIR